MSDLSSGQDVDIVSSVPLTVGSGKTLKMAVINLTFGGTGGTGQIVAAVLGKKIKVYSIIVITTGAVSIGFRSGASTMLQGMMPFAAKVGYQVAVDPPANLLETVAGDALNLVIAGGGSAFGNIAYWDDDSV